MRLHDRAAVVTGAASGIGAASALAMAREGARVVVADIDEAGARRTASAIEKEGGQAFAVRAERGPDGELAFRRPDGRRLDEAPPLPPVPDDVVDVLRAANEAAGLQLDGQAARGTWDGTRFSVGWAIDVMHPRAVGH